MMPSTKLAVDGCARTFSCVDVVPATGATVGRGGGGSGVSVGRGVGAGGSVAVMRGGAVAVGSSVRIEILHPETRLMAIKSEMMCFACTE